MLLTQRILPDRAAFHYNRGNRLSRQGDFEAAIQSYYKSLQINPENADTFYNLGLSLQENRDIEKAIKSYNRALSIKPNYQSARSQKLHQQARICNWIGIENDKKSMLKIGANTQEIVPFGHLALEDCPNRHRLRSELYSNNTYHQRPLSIISRPLQKPERLRIGYFSSGFCEHPVAYLIAKVLELHDRKNFKVYGYSIGPVKDDEMRKRLKKAFDVFHDVKDRDDKDITLLARQDKIDIAIDLNGYTGNNRSAIFAYRAAPVQINYLGYPGTMGADFIDYIIADQNLIPNESQKFYSEKPIYMPHHYQAQDDTLPISDETPSRSELGLPDKGFVFCAMNNTYKITPSEFSIWMRLLQHVDGSVLWLLESNKWVKPNLLKEASARGVGTERLVFAKRTSHSKYLAQFRQADLFLDTFNYNAGATASNALWAGLPVLTKLGTGYSSRMAGSLLASIGLPELITSAEEDYEELALELATNPERIASIKRKLADNRLSKPLFDTELFTKHLEDGYQQAYQLYFDGKDPENIRVKE
jgi:protein O-GlcNAc transferase